jgi:hypothetical protein
MGLKHVCCLPLKLLFEMFFTYINILEFICIETQGGSNVKCLVMAVP